MSTETKPEEPHVHGPDCEHEHPAHGEPAHGEPGHVHGPDCDHDHDGEKPPEKLKQSVVITNVGPCRKHIKVTVERSNIDQLMDEKVKGLVGDSWVPGFRPGKAPKQVVIRKFKKQILEEIRGQILYASLEQMAEENDVAPISPPNLDVEKLVIPDEGDFIYQFEVEVRPEFELPDYKGLKLRKPVRNFTDEDLAKEEKRFLSRYAQLIPKEGAAVKGDTLISDIATTLGEREFGKVQEIALNVDDTLAFKDGVIRNFGDKAVGAKAGDVLDFDYVLGDSVADPSLRGQTAKMKITVKDVKATRFPELDENFLGKFELTSVDQFRERLRQTLDSRLEYAQKQSIRDQILEKIAASSTWDLPQDMLHRQARKSLARKVMEMRDSGMPEDEIKSRQRMLEQNVLENTKIALKEHFVLQKIAEVEKIDIQKDDVEAEIERIAAQTGESVRKVRAQLEREDMMETLAAQLIERKALELILNTAEFEEVVIEEEKQVSNIETQTVPGELQDPTAVPPEAKPE